MSDFTQHQALIDQLVAMPPSNVTKLILCDSFIDGGVLEGMLRQIRGLETFAYGCDVTTAENEGFAANRLAATLVECHAHSLEHLVIIGHESSAVGCRTFDFSSRC